MAWTGGVPIRHRSRRRRPLYLAYTLPVLLAARGGAVPVGYSRVDSRPLGVRD